MATVGVKGLTNKTKKVSTY